MIPERWQSGRLRLARNQEAAGRSPASLNLALSSISHQSSSGPGSRPFTPMMRVQAPPGAPLLEELLLASRLAGRTTGSGPVNKGSRPFSPSMVRTSIAGVFGSVGDVAEWSKAPGRKPGDGLKIVRVFESRRLRHIRTSDPERDGERICGRRAGAAHRAATLAASTAGNTCPATDPRPADPASCEPFRWWR